MKCGHTVADLRCCEIYVGVGTTSLVYDDDDDDDDYDCDDA
jgi:hypothetical protein